MILAPQPEFLLLGADYSALAEFLVSGNLTVRKWLLAEYDVEAHPEDAEADNGYGKQEYFHLQTLEIGQQRLSGNCEHGRNLHHLECSAVAQFHNALDQSPVDA